MAEDEDPTAGIGNVPPWVLRVVRDIAETKSDVRSVRSTVTDISLRLETFVSRREWDEHVSESSALFREKLSPLWDERQQRLGGQAQRERNERLWRWGTGVAIAALTLWALVHTSGVHIQF